MRMTNLKHWGKNMKINLHLTMSIIIAFTISSHEINTMIPSGESLLTRNLRIYEIRQQLVNVDFQEIIKTKDPNEFTELLKSVNFAFINVINPKLTNKENKLKKEMEMLFLSLSQFLLKDDERINVKYVWNKKKVSPLESLFMSWLTFRYISNARRNNQESLINWKVYREKPEEEVQLWFNNSRK